MTIIPSADTRQDLLTSIRFIFFAILTSLIFFAVISYFLIAPAIDKTDENLFTAFIFVVPLFSITMIFLARFLLRKISGQNDNTTPVDQKLVKYRTTKIISWAFIESAGLFNVVAYNLTKSTVFFIVFFVVIAAFFINKPSMSEFITLFGVDPNEKS